MGKFIVA